MYPIQPYGDRGVRIQFGETIHRQVNRKVQNYANLLKNYSIEGIEEWIPAYTTITITYHPDKTTYQKLEQELRNLQQLMDEEEIEGTRTITIPVCYEGAFAPDIEELAHHHQLTVKEVIRIHTEPEYYVYMMGFMPGFSYLGGLSRQIQMPRLDNPRKVVPAGSVGIADQQTGIYPLDSPGGWRIIGKTPIRLYDSMRDKPILIQAGDFLRFAPIDYTVYKSIQEEVEAGSYQPVVAYYC